MIYFAETAALPGLVKIGCSCDPARRVVQMSYNFGSQIELLGFCSGGPLIERDIHVKFDGLRVRYPAPGAGTEWFKLAGDLPGFIEVAIETGSPPLSAREIRTEYAAAMRANGATYQEIADELGVSRQVAHGMVANHQFRTRFSAIADRPFRKIAA